MREGEWLCSAADRAGRSGGAGQGANHPRGSGALGVGAASSGSRRRHIKKTQDKRLDGGHRRDR